MALGRYLADKSAFEQQRHSEAAAGLLSALAADGALFMTEIVALELLYSARSSDDYDVRREDLLSLPWFHLTQAVAARALTVQHELLVAATALEHDAMLLHYDRDFDLIAEVTGLSARWIIPAGTGHGGAV
jgi:predicted nucleic acid-binding protein